MKILFVGLKVGAGIINICNSVRDEIKDEFETEYVDIYGENEKMAKYSGENYYKLVKYIPSLVAFGQKFAYKSCLKTKDHHKFLNKDVKASKVELLKYLERYKPDVVFTPLNFVAIALEELLSEGKTDVKYIFQMPDFMIAYYSHLIRSHTYLFSSCEEVTKILIEKGVDESTIITSGVPISKKFFEKTEREELIKELNLKGDKFILISNGGAGFANNLKIVKEFYDKVGDYTFLVVNGKNEQSKKKIDEFIAKNNVKNVVNLGFINYMPKLMKIADIMIGKCGSSSLCEAASCGVKYIALDNKLFPEIKNIEFIKNRNSAVVVKNVSGIRKALDFYLSEIEKGDEIVENFKQINIENGHALIKQAFSKLK